jgi:5'-deoxynucleotidase YfbR-like HD superfamily hydrolase
MSCQVGPVVHREATNAVPSRNPLAFCGFPSRVSAKDHQAQPIDPTAETLRFRLLELLQWSEFVNTKRRKLTIFLSHSSKDKAFVRRLNRDLKSHFFNTWFDEENIPYGSSITQEIQGGLNKSDIMFVFLSDFSVSSNWVTVEWQAKFFKQINEKKIFVIPILLNDCQIPTFLADRRYVDFRDKDEYETNLSHLLSYLENIKFDVIGDVSIGNYIDYESITDYTREILEDLSHEQISMPIHKRLPIIDTLKKIPRSGKKVRLNEFRPTLKIRTIFDHLYSLAHVADNLLPHINHGIPKRELGDIAICIAYHELNEIVLGDIPTFTSLNTERRNSARIYAEERLRSVPPADRERIANEFIWMFLGEKHRKAFEAAMKILNDHNSRTYITFKTLDKIDPIIAVWRYLNHYRGKLGENPKLFNSKMKDFYMNPDIKAFAKAHKLDSKLIDLIFNLQDREKAWHYYEDPDRIFAEDGTLFEVPKDAVRAAIEGVPLFIT